MDNPVRDNVKARRLITSEWYQRHWGDRVKLTSDQNVKTYFETTATGFRQAAASSGITGKRGDRIILDDPHTWESANSEQQRATTTEWFLGALPTRMNHPKKSAIIVIMQRLHEEDVSGVILEHGGKGLGYDHVMLPMRYDPLRGHAAPQGPIYTRLGYQDPRRDEGELIFPERFPQAYVDRLESTMGPYEVAGQHQQSPEPKGGGIIKDIWWQLWAAPEFPPMDYIIASLDTAYGVKQENDYSAVTVWGVFSVGVTAQMSRTQDRYGRTQAVTRQYTEGAPQIMLMDAWQERLAFPDLVKRVIATCKKAKVDTLIIENKAAGMSVAQELRRTLATEDFGVCLIDTKSLDKVARLYSVQHLFSEGMIWAPDKVYSETVIRQTSSFPKGKHDDLVDTVAHALRHLRDIGVLTRSAERIHAIEQAMRYAGKPPGPLYPG
jgi:predicted phage terminase large subunit-like protein